jgi:ribosomal protein S18 acetylase RimI-like enzyme
VITEATPSEPFVAAQIQAVARAAYVLEAERIGCPAFPPLRESLEKLRQSSDSFLVYHQAGRIVGALSFACSAGVVAITRLVVNPTHLRQGIATALLVGLEQRVAPGVRLTVSTAQQNTPAVLLYQRLGYIAGRVSTSAEGIALMHLGKTS